MIDEHYRRQAKKENSKKYYGVAIREFLKNVSLNLEHLKDRWQDFRQSFMQSVLSENASSEVQRVASRFALVAFGGWLARDISRWNETEALSACQIVFRAWLNNRSGNGQTDAENAIRQVRYFLEQHGSSRFQDLSFSAFDSRIINRAGYKRKNDDGENEFLIFPETFKKEVCKGFDTKLVGNALDKRNYLETETGRQTKQIKLEGKNIRFYIINSNIFETE